MKPVKTLTQRELQERFGWNRYLTTTICRGLEFVRQNRTQHYSVSDVQQSISARLQRPGLQAKTKQILSNTFDRLEGKSNVIEVDFLNKLSFDEEIAFLTAQREQLRVEGHESIRRAKALIEKVEQLGLG